jgi:TldD protein
MPELQLPPAMSALRGELGKIVASVEQRAPYGAVLLKARQGLRISVDDRQEQVTQQAPSAGTVITAFDGETVYERAISGFDPKAVATGARELVQNNAFKRSRDVDPGPARGGDFSTETADALSIEQKLAFCREMRQHLRGMDSRIVNARVTYTENGELSVFGSRTADLAQKVQRITLQALVLVAGENGVRYNWRTKCGTDGLDSLYFGEDELQTIVDAGLALVTAERIEPGEYTVITAPGVTGTICHESFGHGVETDMFLKQRAKAAHYIDRSIGSSLVDIWDDPSYPGGYGSYFFDDEGMLSKPAQIVDEGIFLRGISDLYSATALGVERTANGRRQDFSRKAYARMSNTFFASGATPVEDLFAQVDDGIYLERWSSGMEDPQGWGIQVTCHYGREIKNGKVTDRMFAPIGISGYVPDVLQSISAVGNDWGLDGGTCGKGHKEYISAADGGPHLLMKARLG